MPSTRPSAPSKIAGIAKLMVSKKGSTLAAVMACRKEHCPEPSGHDVPGASPEFVTVKVAAHNEGENAKNEDNNKLINGVL
jgi:hypothetical protein